MAIFENWWTDRHVERLKELWAAVPRMSANDIAIEMGASSRNVIIGKALRIGLGKRGHTPGTSPSTKRRRKRVNLDAPVNPEFPRPAKTVISHPWQGKASKDSAEKARETALANIEKRSESDAAKASTGVSIIELEPNHCRWPLSENIRPILAFRYCGAPKCKESESYCAAHLARSLPNRAVSEAAE